MLDLLAVQSSTTNATIITLAYTLILAFILSSAIGWTYEKTFLGLSYSRNFVQGIVLSAVAASMIMQAIGDNVGRGLRLRIQWLHIAAERYCRQQKSIGCQWRNCAGRLCMVDSSEFRWNV